MQSKRKVMITGVALLVTLVLLCVSATVVYSGGELKPLAAVYSWNCNVNGECGLFNNDNTGNLADGVYGVTDGDWGVLGESHNDTGEGVRAYASGATARALWATSAQYHAVYGQGGTGSGDYGGWFTGYNGLRAEGSGATGYGLYAYSADHYGVSGVGADYGVYGTASDADGQAVRGYTSGTDGYGVYGRAPYNIGVRGEGGTGSDDYGGYFTGFYGVRGDASGLTGRGVVGTASGRRGRAVYGKATGSRAYAGYFVSKNFHGLYADGAGLDAYFPDKIRVGGTTITGFGIALNALNNGGQALEVGDLVAFDGFMASAADDSRPTLAVKKVRGANMSAVVGVVQAAYVEEKASREEEGMMPAVAPPPPPEADEQEYHPVPQEEPKLGQQPSPPRPPVHEVIEAEQELPLAETAAPLMEEAESPPGADAEFIEGPAAPGQYVVVVIQGITRVKVDASAAPVRAGDMLAASRTGYAINATAVASRARKAAQVLIIGRALESLETGTGAIYVFVSVQ